MTGPLGSEGSPRSPQESPLAQQFAQLRRCPVHGIPDCSPLLNGCSIPNKQAPTIEAIERHVQDMEKALRGIEKDAAAGIAAKNRLPYLTGIGVRATIALAVLPAREKGTE